MKYYLMWISNGSIQKDKIAEYSDKSAAVSAFATKWASLEGAAEVKSYIVQLVDSNFDVVDGCKRSNVKEQ